MESIVGYLQDPGWWFTTIFVALIIGVFAGYIRERLVYPMLAAVSERFKERRAKREEAIKVMIAALAANPEFMILTFLRLLFAQVVAVVLWVLLVFILVSSAPRPEITGLLAYIVNPFDTATVFLLVTLFSGFLGYLEYGLLSRATFLNEAYSRYQQDRGLPPVV